ncbi:MAG: sigma-70 family polymerase sigma factor [Chloroflexi bacterium]|jgi:RNA polymerase sigma-70 factor (ECF subfamily)|nr:sigma-70 family polymerase sigma factor [Chloroflexota bacterium]
MGMVAGEPSDENLVARLRNKDTEAFAALYDRHSRLAFGLAYRMLGEPSAAEDVVQEAFLSLWRQAETFKPDRSAARTWLLSIVHHRAIDRLRRVGSREVSDGALEGMPERADDSIDVEHEVGVSLEAAQVRQALGTLPLEQQQAIELAYFGGFSHSEIAQKLDVPIGTVKGRLRIGLQKMRLSLGQAHLEGAARDA